MVHVSNVTLMLAKNAENKQKKTVKQSNLKGTSPLFMGFRYLIFLLVFIFLESVAA